MIKFVQAICSQALFIGVTGGIFILIAVILSMSGMAYFEASSRPITGGDGPGSWHLSRWSNTRATPRHELPDWALNKQNPPELTEEQKQEVVRKLRAQ